MRNSVLRQKPIDSDQSINYFINPIDFHIDVSKRRVICDYTSLINGHFCDLDIQWGLLFIWSNKLKKYESVYYHHTWNIDDDDIIYDDFKSIQSLNESFSYINVDSSKEITYRLLDGSLFKSNVINVDRRFEEISKKLSKMFKIPLKRPTLIYITDIGYDGNNSKYNWEKMEQRWDYIESNELDFTYRDVS